MGHYGVKHIIFYCGGKNEQETIVYFWALFPYLKTLLTTLTNSALVFAFRKKQRKVNVVNTLKGRPYEKLTLLNVLKI